MMILKKPLLYGIIVNYRLIVKKKLETLGKMLDWMKKSDKNTVFEHF